MSKRMSSLGGRPSISGAPHRIPHEHLEGRGVKQVSSSKLRSSGSQSKLSGNFNRQSYMPRDSNKFSMASKSGSIMPATGRTSGHGVRGRTDIPKDPRPINDRAYLHQCTRKVLDFLIRNNYPHAISEKLLAAPPSKDFFKIFEFIHGMLSIGYKMGVKMEEEVPRILKMLGYPFNVSKTYLYSVGSPHVWPNLCAALTWMIDLVEMAEGISEHGVDAFIFQEPMESEREGVEEAKICFDYCEKTYQAFMSGVDTFEEYDDELKELLQRKYQGRNIEEIMEENRKLEEELHILGQTEERLQRVRENVSVGQQNLQKYRNYCAEMEIYKRSLSGKLTAVEEDCKMLDTEYQLKQQQLEELKEMFENQQIKPTDVERMKEESENLKRQIKELELQNDLLDEDSCKVNIEMAKITEKVASEVAAYHKAAIDLKLIPESAENANGQDYSIQVNCTSMTNNDIEHTTAPKLLQMKKQLKEEIRRLNKQKFQRLCDVEQLQEIVNDSKEEVARIKEALAKLEAELETLKQLSQQEKKSCSSEKTRIEETLAELKLKAKEAEVTKSQKILEINKLLKEQEIARKDRDKEIQTLTETRDKMRETVAVSRENLTTELENMVAYLEKENMKADELLADIKRQQKEREQWLEEKRSVVENLLSQRGQGM